MRTMRNKNREYLKNVKYINNILDNEKIDNMKKNHL